MTQGLTRHGLEGPSQSAGRRGAPHATMLLVAVGPLRGVLRVVNQVGGAALRRSEGAGAVGSAPAGALRAAARTAAGPAAAAPS